MCEKKNKIPFIYYIIFITRISTISCDFQTLPSLLENSKGKDIIPSPCI